MALKKEVKDRLKALGIDPDALATAIADTKEVDFTLPEGEMLTTAQLTTRDEQKAKEGRKEGEKEAANIAKTEIKKHAGIELKGERWGDIGIELKAAINASNDTKIASLTEQNTLLLKDKETLSTEITQVKAAADKTIFEGNVMAKMPGVAPGFKSLKETLEVARMRGYDFENTADGPVVKLNGEVLKDKQTHKPLDLESGIKTVFESEKWNAASAPPKGGRGLQQTTIIPSAGGIMKASDATKAYEDANPGKKIYSLEGQAFFNECAKTPGFNVNE